MTGGSLVQHDRLTQAMTLHQQGMLLEAAKIYEEILRQQPGHFDALHLLGQVALNTQRVERGVALIRLAIALQPDAPAAYSNLGIGLCGLDRFEEAIASFDKAIALKADYVEAHNNRGAALTSCRRYEEALVSYDNAIALKPDYPESHYNRGNTLCALQRVEEALACFSKAIALKPDYAKAHYNRGNVLADLRRHEEAVVSYGTAIALRADYAEAFANRGAALRNLRRYEEAVVDCDKAIAVQPDYAEAHNNRGMALHDLWRYQEALASCDMAIALKPDYAEVHSNRGAVLRDLQRSEAALASCDKAIALKPDYAAAYCNRGVALGDLRRYAEALRSFNQAIALRPDYADAHANKSFLLLRLGEFAAGWEEYEWRKKLDKPMADRSYQQPAWLGKPDIAGRTLFIHWDQGFGDTLQFCRYVRLVRALGIRVVMSVQDALLPLLRQLEPAIQIIGGNQAPVAFDYHCSLTSLPLALGTTLETIPAEPGYLAADAKLRNEWAERLPPKRRPRIGLVWRGSPVPNPYRSMRLTTLLPLLRDDVEWICLQQELDEEGAALLRQDGRIAFVGDRLRDFSDTAALVDLMDLVITIDTSVAHLAGAMDKPVWVLLTDTPDWRWLTDRNDSPWYPAARLFRQREAGNWDDVVDRVRSEFDRMIDGGAWS
jgi:tetratricopeptide (TPR) repeat protein